MRGRKLNGKKRVKKYMHKEIKIKYNFTMYMDLNVVGWTSRAGGEAAIPARPPSGGKYAQQVNEWAEGRGKYSAYMGSAARRWRENWARPHQSVRGPIRI